MRISSSVLEELLQRSPNLHPHLYFKSSLTALSHAMEDQVLAAGGDPLVIANFQQERFYRQEAHRYRRIASLSAQTYVLAAPETSFTHSPQEYELIAFDPDDQLSHEWHLIVISATYSACLICRERTQSPEGLAAMDQSRRFEGVWTFDRHISSQAAEILLDRIQCYRPDLAPKITEAKAQLAKRLLAVPDVATDPFAQRLVTHLQAGQYKLLKAYRSIASQERRERLINSMVMAIRQSLDPEEIFCVGVKQLQQAMEVCRCVIYRCKQTDVTASILYEARREEAIPSLLGQSLPLQANPLFQQVAQTLESVAIANTTTETTLDLTSLQPTLKQWQIHSWLMVPVVYQGRLLGMVELHHCLLQPHSWSEEEQSLVEAIASQLGVALIQAESYANLEDLNAQLAALDRTRSNLIAITGHELRTPLSTIQICLESLAAEPDMPTELQQVMLSTALTDAERMRKLVQDFITLSRLESGRVEWHLEALAIGECVNLALSSLRTRQRGEELPKINTQVSEELPLVRADGERLVEVLSKLLDNACKFTEPEGEVVIEAHPNGDRLLEVTISDTGRGIEPTQLEAVFDRFYQEEESLRRTTSGTGLGLAICRQIILAMGGQIWAESAGRECGSRFHFTVPIAKEIASTPPIVADTGATPPSRKRRSPKAGPKAK